MGVLIMVVIVEKFLVVVIGFCFLFFCFVIYNIIIIFSINIRYFIYLLYSIFIYYWVIILLIFCFFLFKGYVFCLMV